MSARGDNVPTEGGADPTAEEYPARSWRRIYAVVLGVLVLDIAVFAALTAWFR